MQNYTHLTARELESKWLELIGRPIPPVGRSLIIKYLLWYEQAKREKISPLGFFHKVAQAAKTQMGLCGVICHSFGIVGQFVEPKKRPNTELIKILNQSYPWHQEILDGKTTQEIANREKVCVQYVRRLLNLSFLSPKIVRAILNGTQPAVCTLKKLLSIKSSNWHEQEQIFYK